MYCEIRLANTCDATDETKLVKTKPEIPDEQFVRIDDKTYPTLKRYSNESGIPIDELASSMIAFAICHLVIEEYDPKKKQNKGR